MKSIAKKEIIYFLLFGVILLMIFYLSSVLLPFFIGVFLAYLLDPCVDYLEKCNLNRGLASIFILIIFFLGFSFITFLILPILFAQTISFLNEFPNIINELDKRFRSVLELLREKIIFIQVKDFINNIMPNLSQLAPKFLNSLISSSLALVHILGLLFITPIVTWYFLRDWDKILKKFLGTLSKKYKILLLDYSNNIKLILDAYLRGQLLVSLSLCFYYSLFFYFLELNYSLFIGVFAGFFSFIPLIGIIFSFLITSILAYLQFIDLIYIIYIFIVFVVGQLLESNFLTPRLIGDKLGLHPLAVILSIFIFGALFGIIGVIFSIPITAIILLVFRKNILNK